MPDQEMSICVFAHNRKASYGHAIVATGASSVCPHVLFLMVCCACVRPGPCHGRRNPDPFGQVSLGQRTSDDVRFQQMLSKTGKGLDLREARGEVFDTGGLRFPTPQSLSIIQCA